MKLISNDSGQLFVTLYQKGYEGVMYIVPYVSRNRRILPSNFEVNGLCGALLEEMESYTDILNRARVENKGYKSALIIEVETIFGGISKQVNVLHEYFKEYEEPDSANNFIELVLHLAKVNECCQAVSFSGLRKGDGLVFANYELWKLCLEHQMDLAMTLLEFLNIEPSDLHLAKEAMKKDYELLLKVNDPTKQ